MCLDGEKNDRVAFQARADYQNHAIGWLHRGYSPLAVGKWYDFHEFGWYMGNVGSKNGSNNTARDDVAAALTLAAGAFVRAAATARQRWRYVGMAG